MEPSPRATGYDLFKLIVAILLLILFFLLRSRATPQSPTPLTTVPATAPASSTPIPLTATSVPIHTSIATTVAAATQTLSLSPTGTNMAITTTSTPVPSPMATNAAEQISTSLPSPSAIPVLESTPIPTPETAALSACDTASSHSRLQTGMRAIILRRLNFRSSPGIGNNWLLTNIPGTKVEVVGGPECIPHSIGAYVWWQIKLPDGQIGWSAEASQQGAFYFMEPIR